MGYVHPGKTDIFLSYAHVDDEPDHGDRPGWVTSLARGLEKRLAQKLGRRDSYVVWRDAKLAGHVNINRAILGQVRDASVLLLILSPAYLASEWCRQELAAFYQGIRMRKAPGERVFVVEFDRVERGRRPPELANLKAYPFWVEDPDTGNPRTLGRPIVHENDGEYYKRLNDLCIELVRELEAINPPKKPHVPPSTTVPGRDTRAAIYLAEVTEDLET